MSNRKEKVARVARIRRARIAVGRNVEGVCNHTSLIIPVDDVYPGGFLLKSSFEDRTGSRTLDTCHSRYQSNCTHIWHTLESSDAPRAGIQFAIGKGQLRGPL
jgi:hypothetical protein